MAHPAEDLDRTHDPGPDVSSDRAVAVEESAVEPIPWTADHEVRVGTASWTDPTMTAPGVFYPRDADTAEERLQFYASRFPVVEVDATYYALPNERTSQLWVERTPPDFVFDIKAHALLTGQPTETKRLPKDIRTALPAELAAKSRLYSRDLPAELQEEVFRRFREGIEPLRAGGQLGAIFLQYPRWFFPVSESRDTILDAVAHLDGFNVAVEFRHGSWFNEKNVERTLRFLSDHDIALVVVDGPQGFKSSIPPVVTATSAALAVVRFHGRRTATWEAQGVPTVERFRYLYDRGELGEWAPRVGRLAAEARETHVLMNNCYANYGSTNARELAKLLRDLNPDDYADVAGTSGGIGAGA
jgi:uncharacterized protein YecE (DUF72 family)